MPLIAALALLLGAGAAAGAPPAGPSPLPTPSAAGHAAPPIPAERVLNGKAEDIRWETLRGKVVLVDFFSIACKPCIKAMPMLVDLQKRYRDRFAIVGYHIGRGSPDEVSALIRKMGLNYPVAMPPGWDNPKVDIPGNDFLAQLGSEMLPAGAIVDAQGVLRHWDLRPDAAQARVLEMLKK